MKISTAAVVKVALLLLVLCTGAQLYGDELDVYSRYLDRVESNFWRAVFARNISNTRTAFNTQCQKLSGSARRIYQLRKQHDSLNNSGDLIAVSQRIAGLVVDGMAPRKKRIYVSGLKKTGLDEFRKKIRRNSNVRRGQKVPASELSLDEYRDFLSDIKEHNLKLLDSRFEANRDLSRTQRNMLKQTAEKFYDFLSEARANILMLRQNDPAFKVVEKKKSILK